MTASPPPVSFGQALRFWLQLGFVSFGGPAGQIALMHEELVRRRRWISEARFLHALNYCMVLPGPEAQQLATYLGWLMHRTAGGIAAGALFVLPSLLILILLSWAYLVHAGRPWLAGLLYGIQPAVLALVLHAAWRLGGRVLRTPLAWALAVAAWIGLTLARLPFPLVIGAAAGIGALAGRWRPAWLQPPGASAPHAPAPDAARAGPAQPPAWIDDHTPPPPHARHDPRRLALVIGVCLLLAALPFAALVAFGGADGPLARMAVFFGQAALMTFGGAYAVLPYVYQGAVSTHGWLSATQMIDGLALGETTPGPLIMIVAFVGFVGGWQSPALTGALGPEHTLLAGVLGAVVATWFTFLPSFAFILAGGPLVEATHGRVGFTAPLAAISAAVVGVIATLALLFGAHVLWPRGLAGPAEWPAAVLALLASLALIVARRGTVEVIVACALAGWAWQASRT